MPQVGFKPVTPATKQPQTYALDRVATGISIKHVTDLLLLKTGSRTTQSFFNKISR
jgi:hypothetical protein